MKIVILLIISIFSCGCTKKNTLPHGFLDYPYLAKEDRAEKIRNEIQKLKIGDDLSTAITLMGRPDELNPTFDKRNWDERIGYSLVYVIRRDCEYGSVHEKNEELVRIHFNFNDLVTRIDMEP
jgi:hypothetical protein